MTSTDPQSGSINRYYLTLSSYAIDPRYLDDPRIRPGDGIDLRNPLSPEVTPYRAFEDAVIAAVQERGLPKASDVIQESAVLKESLTEHEESSVLSTFFKASYMLSSVQGAYEAAKTEQETYHSVYALVEHSGEAERLPAQHRVWRTGEVPASESVADRDEALLQFVLSYGSHYISSIIYGLRIAVQGKLRKDSKVSATDFSTTFKAAFGSFSAEAGVRNEQRQKLESMSIDLVLEATSGGHEGGPLVLRGFDGIAQFLSDVKDNKIHFSVAPIRLTLKSYWPTMDPKWEKTRALLNPLSASFKTPCAPYGVPKGTIIAWHPTPDHIKGLEKEPPERTIFPPSGWAICDGTLGTPDLTGRFIRGVSEWTPTVTTGGMESHIHRGKTLENDGDKQHRGGSGGKSPHAHSPHYHTVELGPDKHLPPYAELVYIMKLDDLP